MNHNDAFSRCHPLVNFLYFALVLLGAMVLQHPVCQVISLIGAIACFCCLGGEKPGGFRLWYALALFVPSISSPLSVLYTPLFDIQSM